MYSVSRSSCYVHMHVVAIATVVEIPKLKDLQRDHTKTSQQDMVYHTVPIVIT